MMKPATPSSSFDDATVHGGLQPADAPAMNSPFVAGVTLFDACHVGVVLRVVLFVQAAAGVSAMFGASDPLDWLLRFSLLTGGVLPATLVWLITVCAFKGWLNNLAVAFEWLAGILVGVGAALPGH